MDHRVDVQPDRDMLAPVTTHTGRGQDMALPPPTGLALPDSTPAELVVVTTLAFVYADVHNGMSIGGALNKHPQPWTDRAQGYIVDVFVKLTDDDAPSLVIDASTVVANAIVLAAADAAAVARNGNGV